MVFLRKVSPWNEFEMLYLVLLLIMLERWSKYISLLESHFISDFSVVAESFYKGFLRSFSSKCFQSLGIEPSVILYIYYMVDSRKI